MENNIKVTIWGREVGRLTWNRRKKVMAEGRQKMPEELQRGYVIEYFVPRYTERHSAKG